MSEILLSAVSCGFFMVRVVKGTWLRNPQYLAAAILGAVVAAVLLHAFSPDMDNDFIAGSLAGIAGSWIGMMAFDKVLGTS